MTEGPRAEAPAETVSRAEALRVWVAVALQSFGGPAGQIAVIHRMVVDEKRWLGEQRFLHALSYCMLLPGPEAQQLATYVGWLLHGVRGGLVAGCLFIAPGFVTILVLSVLYAGFRDVRLVAGIFYGLKPAVIAVVIQAVIRIGRRALTGASAVGISVGAFVAIFAFAVPFPVIVAAAAVLGALLHRGAPAGSQIPPEGSGPEVTAPSLAGSVRTATVWLVVWLAPLAGLTVVLGSDHLFVQEGVFFSKAAVVTFGGAYAVLTYVAQQAVETYQWLQPGQMLDGLGMAETTPGPLIQVVQFVGFMGGYGSPGGLSPVTAGVVGSLVTTWVTFAPCFMFIFVGAPYVEYLRRNRLLNSALRGITAAVVGVVLNLSVWFALHTLFGEVATLDVGPMALLVPEPSTVDWAALLVTAGAAAALFRWKAAMLPTLGGAAVAGILLTLFQ